MLCKWLLPLALIVAIAWPSPSGANPPVVADKGSLSVSETCEGITTAVDLSWQLARPPERRGVYAITYIDVKRNDVSQLTNVQREKILQDLLRWTEFWVLSFSEVYPLCRPGTINSYVLINFIQGYLHGNGAPFDRLALEINPDHPEKTGLYATRLIDGKVQQVPASIAQLPPWKDPPAKK